MKSDFHNLPGVNLFTEKVCKLNKSNPHMEVTALKIIAQLGLIFHKTKFLTSRHCREEVLRLEGKTKVK